MNCAYHALSEFLRGESLLHRDGWNSCFMGPFEGARRPYSTRGLDPPSPPWRRALLPGVIQPAATIKNSRSSHASTFREQTNRFTYLSVT